MYKVDELGVAVSQNLGYVVHERHTAIRGSLGVHQLYTQSETFDIVNALLYNSTASRLL